MSFFDIHLVGTFLFCIMIISSYIWVKYKSNNAWISHADKKKVHKLFNAAWDGTEEDRWYAWLKVRRELKTHQRDIKKICYVYRKLLGLQKRNKIKQGKFYMDENSMIFLNQIKANYKKLYPDQRNTKNTTKV